MWCVVLQVSHRGSGPRGSSNQTKSPSHSSANLCRRHDKSVQVRPHHMSSYYNCPDLPQGCWLWCWTAMLHRMWTHLVCSGRQHLRQHQIRQKLKRLWSKKLSNHPRFTDTEETVGVVVRRGVCILRTTLEKPDITVQAWFCVLTTKKDYDDDEDGNMVGG